MTTKRSVLSAVLALLVGGQAIAGAEDLADRTVAVGDEVLEEFDIEVRTAGTGRVSQTLRLPGEVAYNADRIAEVNPAVEGIVRRVDVSVGDVVEPGQVLAVIDSRELAAARSRYRAAQARVELAEANLARDERMLEEKVGTERAVLEARKAQREAEIALREAETALHALGQDHDDIDRIESLAHGALNRYRLVAPLGGTVTDRRLTIGEVVGPADGETHLVIADLSKVWVNLTVYQRDLAHVRQGQQVTIERGYDLPAASGNVEFVSPALDPQTRTAFARIVLDNPGGRWRPGTFVDGVVETGREVTAVIVPRSAVSGWEDEPFVFVRTEQGFQPRPVRLGHTTERQVAVIEGLRPGERYAATSVLALESQLESDALEHAGHAH